MRPIVIIDTPPVIPTKERTITIYKQKVYEDIDAETYKFSDARPDNAPQRSNALASDSSERTDGHILARNVEFRDAKIRRRINRALKNTDEVLTANDNMVLDATFVYNLVLDMEFRDAMLEPLKGCIHRYLVWGALYDWYGSSLGESQANFYKGELTELENAIVGLITLPNTAKRPLQPFGPAQKIY